MDAREMKMYRIYRFATTVIYIFSGTSFGIYLSEVVNQGTLIINNNRIYFLLSLATILLIVANIARKKVVKSLQMRIEIINFILAYREFEEERLSNFTKGSQEWLEVLEEFAIVCKNHGARWEALLQNEIDQALEEHKELSQT